MQGLLFLLMPRLIMLYYRFRVNGANLAKDKAYWVYRAASFYLNQIGIPRGDRTPMQYATQVVDVTLGDRQFASFMNAYLKQKYAKQALSPQEQVTVTEFLGKIIKSAKRTIPARVRIAGFLNPMRAISFFVVPENEKQE